MLFDWKQVHEDWLRNGGIVPAIPEFSIKTLNGFTLPDVPGTIALKECKDLREHRFQIRNNSPTVVLMIDAKIQMPEPIVAAWGRERPAGVTVEFQPDRQDIIVSGTGKVTRNGPPLASKVFRLRIDRLPPAHPVEIAVYTSVKAHEDHDLSFDTGPFAEFYNGDYLIHFIDGTFQFEYRGATIIKKFFAPIHYDKDTRATSVIEIREDIGDWKPVDFTLMS
jgi:hypothetical protein